RQPPRGRAPADRRGRGRRRDRRPLGARGARARPRPRPAPGRDMSAVFAGAPVLPQERLWVWRLVYPPVRAIASFLAPWRIEGAERIPPRGPFIVVTNHLNWKDPPWIEFALGRAIRYMAKREVFEIPILGFTLRGIGCFPVRRGEADRGALAGDPQAVADAVMRRIAALLPVEMRGVYAA